MNMRFPARPKTDYQTFQWHANWGKNNDNLSNFRKRIQWCNNHLLLFSHFGTLLPFVHFFVCQHHWTLFHQSNQHVFCHLRHFLSLALPCQKVGQVVGFVQPAWKNLNPSQALSPASSFGTGTVSAGSAWQRHLVGFWPLCRNLGRKANGDHPPGLSSSSNSTLGCPSLVFGLAAFQFSGASGTFQPTGVPGRDALVSKVSTSMVSLHAANPSSSTSAASASRCWLTLFRTFSAAGLSSSESPLQSASSFRSWANSSSSAVLCCRRPCSCPSSSSLSLGRMHDSARKVVSSASLMKFESSKCTWWLELESIDGVVAEFATCLITTEGRFGNLSRRMPSSVPIAGRLSLFDDIFRRKTVWIGHCQTNSYQICVCGQNLVGIIAFLVRKTRGNHMELRDHVVVPSLTNCRGPTDEDKHAWWWFHLSSQLVAMTTKRQCVQWKSS